MARIRQSQPWTFLQVLFALTCLHQQHPSTAVAAKSLRASPQPATDTDVVHVNDNSNNTRTSITERDLINVQTRVVGGNDVSDLDKHPFFAEWHAHFCGGALIHDDLVLTAAHCNNGNTPLSKDIFFRNLKRRQTGSVQREITHHQSHPKYNRDFSTRDYDYLILKLDKSALIDEFGNPTGVETIAINTNPSIPATGDSLWGIGFGQVGENVAGMSDTLRDVAIGTFSNATCEGQYGQFFEKDYMFCSGVANGGKDTCQGDSGGPIVHQDTGTLVGVVSFGIGCARRNYSGVNSRVSAAQAWIDDAKCRYSNYPSCGGTNAATDAAAPTTTVAGAASRTGSGSLTVTLVLDEYPQEVAWIMSHKGSGETMHFQPYKSLTTPRATVSKTFDNLQEGETFTFRVSDMEGDGICCIFGNGEISIRDDVQGVDVWSSRGNYGNYYEVDLEIQTATSFAQVVGRSGQYKPSSWTEMENMIAPSNEPGWPGALPTANTFSLVVNVDTDDYPEENTWELLHRDPDATEVWTVVDQWDGADDAGFRVLDSTEITNLKRGWYHFVFKDSEGDGNCCDYGSGWVSLTGPLAVSQGQKGLVWGSAGNFLAMKEIYFEIGNSGYISHINFYGVSL